MTLEDPHAGAPGHGGSAKRSDDIDPSQLGYALTTRFAAHIQAAATAVRAAEQELADAQEKLSLAQQAAENQRYQADRLVFMRASVEESVESLTRKSTPKKVKVAYNYLVARAVELAEGEIHGYREDLAAAHREREDSVAACLRLERQASEQLDAARAMQQRVYAAEQAARQGLAVLVEKYATQQESGASA